ncbi:DUF4190 domain-containing protein [Williamsia sp. CHRR-6]|uniref:DUF4190 domain-containing protein n=1 Tax=Williamsia sp. CHRR-6 TaxID=2835871 RepID=UPI001BDB5277|nr:DUF4190 domain-containing protein [Williamsia sp. CHRR-6]MBT0567731.1 DUF4190 domain-containing protein [Williamsia sp. CHRR-6]
MLSGPAAHANAAYSLSPERDSIFSETRDAYGGHDDTIDDSDQDPVNSSAPNTTNILAIVSLVLSFLGITSLFGVICAHVARRQIQQSREQGRSLTTAALWIGYFYLATLTLCLGVYLAIAGQGN